MKSRKTIGIIGCGVFGAEIALKLSSKGFLVDVFEKNSELLNGATLNNQNRLHLGFHYPRDDATAEQCIKGFKRFKDSYSDCIDGNFTNAYFISSKDSKTTPDNYLDFCKRVGLKFKLIDSEQFPIEVRGVDLCIMTNEVVYDCNILRKLIMQKLKKSEINVIKNTNINDLLIKGDMISVYGNNKYIGDYDYVINCTYANINTLTNRLGFEVSENQYEYTFVPIIELDIPRVGVTIMDGNFFTLLPYGKSNQYLLYHVNHSVLLKEVSTIINSDWFANDKLPVNKMDLNQHFNLMIDSSIDFLPVLKKAKLKGFLHGPRMVKSKKDDTDERLSSINFYEKNYCTVYSGKIDHCIWVADDVEEWIS